MPSRVTFTEVTRPPAKAPATAPYPAPGAVERRSSTLRPASGRSLIFCSVRTEPTDAEVVAIRVPATAVTSTAWAWAAACNLKFNRTCWVIPRATCS